MSDVIDDVTILGGGDSGLMTALAVTRQNPSLDVSVVDDFERDIPQVGKSTFLEIRQVLHSALGINERRFVEEVKPIWKASVYFRDWCGNDPFHYPFDAGSKFPATNTPNAVEDYYYWYDELYRNDEYRTICEEIVAQDKSPWYFNAQKGQYDRYDRTAYHLNTERFNTFLRAVCRERDIALIDDAIVDVEASGSTVDHVRSKSQRYKADLFVDASGFARILKDELDSEFRSFPIPLDSAFNVRIDTDLSEVIPATVVESGDYGWFWHIDTIDNRDLGYVFASEYVDDETALEEFITHVEALGGDVERDDFARYGFTSGYFAPAWEGNCVAIGNAEGFVEPLQSTALTINGKAGVRLASLLATHGRVQDDAIRETYNDWVHESWESIGDFIGIHYTYGDGDTDFWQDVSHLDLGERVDVLERAFDRNGLNRDVDPTSTADGVNSLETFTHMDFYLMMRNMGATSEFYETHDFTVGDAVRQKKADINESTRNHVEDYITTEQMYKTVVDQQF